MYIKHCSSMRRPILTIALAMTMLTAGAQINSPQSAGYLSRGRGMELTSNYLGAIDQLTHLKQLSPDASAEREGLYLKAMAAFERRQYDARQLLEAYLGAYPASAERLVVSLAIADCDFRQGKYAEAYAQYDRLPMNAFDQDNAASLCFHKGFCLLKLGEYDKARAVFATLDRSATYGNAARFYQGYAAYAQGNYTEAEALLKGVDTSTTPGNLADAYLSQIYYLRGDYSAAITASRSVLNSSMAMPEGFRAEAMRITGESLYHQGKLEQALKYLNEYVAATDEPLPSTLYILGLTDYRQGKYEAAIDALTPVTQHPDAMGQGAYLLIGQSYMKLGNVNAAAMALDKAAQMDFDREVAEVAFYNYAVARTNGGRVPFGNAVTNFEEFLQRYPDSRYAGQVQDYIVTGYVTDNNFEQALASINKIKKPTNTTLSAKQQVLYTLGVRAYGEDDVMKAESLFRQAKAVGRYNTDVACECDLWIGDCEYAQGKYADAAKSYLDYVNATPASSANRAMGYYNLGYTRFKQKRYEDAIADFDRYLAASAGSSPAIIGDAYTRIGDCQYYLREYDKAAASYQKAIDSAPEIGDYALYQRGVMAGINRKYSDEVTVMDELLDKFPSSALVADAMLQKAQAQTQMGDLKAALSTYRTLASTYQSTEQGRRGMVLTGVTLAAMGNKDEAITTYREVISNYPTSDQAQLAVDNLKELYAERGQLNALAQFLATVDGAPQVDGAEIEQLTFETAAKDYTERHNTDRLKEYVKNYANGRNAAHAYEYLLEAALDGGNQSDALTYATVIVENYPHSSAVEQSLLTKGDIEFAQGKGEKALATYTELEKRASTPEMQAQARLGMARVNAQLGRYAQVVATADKLLASGATNINRDDVLLQRGLAYYELGDKAKAISDLKPLTATPATLTGSTATYYVGQMELDNGNLKEARTMADKLVDSNTSHFYWLARGFILLSDISRAEGNVFEADEYLRQLKANYPGGDDDINTLIDQRLK